MTKPNTDKPVVKAVAVNENLKAATDMVSLISNDKEMQDYATMHIASVEQAKKGAFHFAMLIEAADSALIGAGQDGFLDRLPKVGSKRPEGDKSNVRFDKYDETYTDANGDKRTRERSFISDFADAFPTGKAIAKRIEAIQNRTGEYAGLGDDICIDALATAKDNRQSNRTLFRRAIGFLQKFDEVNELADVTAKVVTRDGKPTDGIKPIKVFQTSNPDETAMLLTLSAFLKYNPTIAAENGGSWEAFIATGPKKGAGKGAEGEVPAGIVPRIVKADVALQYVNELVAFFSNEATFATLIAATAKTPDEYVGAIGKLEEAINTYCDRHRAKIASLKQAERHAAEAEAKAKAS